MSIKLLWRVQRCVHSDWQKIVTFLAIINLHQVITARGLNFKWSPHVLSEEWFTWGRGHQLTMTCTAKIWVRNWVKNVNVSLCLKSDLAAVAMDSQCYVCSWIIPNLSSFKITITFELSVLKTTPRTTKLSSLRVL